MKFRMILSFLLLLATSFAATAQRNVQRDMANARAAYDALNRRDYNAFITLCAPEFTEYTAGPQPVTGPANCVEVYKMFFAAFPDLKFKILEIASPDNGRYYLKVQITGTNTGSFNGLPATGKKVDVVDVDIVEVNTDSKATSHWSANPNGMLTAIGYGSVANESVGVVMAVYEKFGKGDVPGILSMCTADVKFDIHDSVFDNKQRTFKGQSEVAAFFKELGQKAQYSTFQPWRFVADGDDVFVLVNVAYKHLPAGKNYETTYTHQFKVVNGKVAYFKGLDEIQTAR